MMFIRHIALLSDCNSINLDPADPCRNGMDFYIKMAIFLPTVEEDSRMVLSI